MKGVYDLNPNGIKKMQYDCINDSTLHDVKIICNETTGIDTVDLQYLFCCLKYLERNSRTPNVLFVNENQNEISADLYFSIRATLFFLLKNNNEVSNRVKAKRAGDSLSSSRQNGVAFISNKSISKDLKEAFDSLGRILPIIPITSNTIVALNTIVAVVKQSTTSAYTDLMDLLNIYIEKLENYILIDKQSESENTVGEFVKKYFKADTLLDAIIFASTIYYTYKNGRKKVHIESNELELLHETCVDYAQGIYQLIENSYLHCMHGNEHDGCANFTIRIRKKGDAQTLYLQKNNEDFKELKDINYFMELYVTDLQYDGFESLIEKFKTNALSRQNQQKNEVNWSNVKLENLFTGEGEIAKYLSESSNIALHYGLQILNNIVSVANGHLQVVSGEEYCNNNAMYIKKTLEWDNGTAYVIYLPLKIRTIDLFDTAAISYDKTAPVLFDVKYLKLNLCENINVISKTTAIQQVTKKIQTDNPFCVGLKDAQTIFVVDCKNINISQYEILAKSIFILLTDVNIEFSPCHIALKNVVNRNEVIKIFRQFALFYNRLGKSPNMNRELVAVHTDPVTEEQTFSIYIVDINAELDILLTNDLKTIGEDLYESQINGGMDDLAILILKHLMGGRV